MKLPTFSLLRLAALALAASAVATGALAATTAHYFDGDTQRTITLDTGLVAVITPIPEAGSAQARSVGEGASPAPLVQLQPANQPVAKGAGTQVSPVYREGNSPAGRLMALPGGVVVKFNTDWTDAQVRAWAQAKGLTVTQRLGTTSSWYLIATAPGSAALELANSLKAGGEVLAAMPNWWKQTAAR
ncbi:MAG: hypothetical protein V4679_18020 [Pseudomonadota bacterium]